MLVLDLESAKWTIVVTLPWQIASFYQAKSLAAFREHCGLVGRTWGDRSPIPKVSFGCLYVQTIVERIQRVHQVQIPLGERLCKSEHFHCAKNTSKVYVWAATLSTMHLILRRLSKGRLHMNSYVDIVINKPGGLCPLYLSNGLAHVHLKTCSFFIHASLYQ